MPYSLQAAEAMDIQSYMVDLCATLHAFLQVCPSEAMHAFVADGFLLRFGSFYEKVVSNLENFWKLPDQIDTAAVGVSTPMANPPAMCMLLRQAFLQSAVWAGPRTPYPILC
jgi:hypothetical protein